MSNGKYLTVKALTKYISRKFTADPYLANIYVKGEISNFKEHTSGHMYFTLKDSNARIMAVMFSSANKGLPFKPENGMNVLVCGNVSVYEASGQYQLYVKSMEPDGLGALFVAYEQLKEKLGKMGLFQPDTKQAIPPYPEKIGVITSPTGAAIRDIITTIKRRYPMGKILVFPALVQGEHAADSIKRAIENANEGKKVDVLIVGRGGGSIEELWAFNEEMVAFAIHHSKIPIISAVGHETDFTIADFVADLRAPTPTAAAELAVPHLDELLERLLNRKSRLVRSIGEKVRIERKRLHYIEQSYIFRNPHKLYEQKMENLDKLTEKLRREQVFLFQKATDSFMNLEKRLKRKHPTEKLMASKERCKQLEKALHQHLAITLRQKQQEFAKTAATLEALSPLKIMERGFSLAYEADGTILKSIKQVRKQDAIKLQLSDGKLYCTVEQTEVGRTNV